MMKKGKIICVCLMVCILFSMAAVSANEDINQTLGIESDSSIESVNNNVLLADNSGDSINNTILSEGNNPSSQINYWYVNASQPSGNGSSSSSAFKTLNEALHVANDGDIILIAPGLYNGSGQNVNLKIDKNLTFILNGEGEAIFDANGESCRIWTITSSCINIMGLNFVNSKSGALLFENDLKNSYIYGFFENNVDLNYGGAIYFQKSLYNSRINGKYINNQAGLSGGANYFSEQVINSVITGTYDGNSVGFFGGANAIGFITNSTLSGTYTNNLALIAGGANFLAGCDNVVFDAAYTNNTAKIGSNIRVPVGYTMNNTIINEGKNSSSQVNFLFVNDTYSEKGEKGLLQILQKWYPVFFKKQSGNGLFPSSPFVTLSEALQVAKDGDFILIAPGHYTGQKNVDLYIDKKLNLCLFGEGEAKFDAQTQPVRIWTIGATSINITGLTFVNGRPNKDHSSITMAGGALLFEKELKDSIISGYFENNVGASCGGGAICFEKSIYNVLISGAFINNTVDNVYGERQGGAICFYGDVVNSYISGLFMNNHINLQNEGQSTKGAFGGVNCFLGRVINSSITGMYFNNYLITNSVFYTIDSGLGGLGGVNYFDRDVINVTLNGTYIGNIAYDGAVNYFASSGRIQNLTIDGNYTHNHGYAYYNEYEKAKSKGPYDAFEYSFKKYWDANAGHRMIVVLEAIFAVAAVVVAWIAPHVSGTIAFALVSSFVPIFVGTGLMTWLLIANTTSYFGDRNKSLSSQILEVIKQMEEQMNNTFWSNSSNILGNGGVNCFMGSVSDLKMTGVYRNNTAELGGVNYFYSRGNSISKLNIAGIYADNKAIHGGVNYFEPDIVNSSIDGTYTNNQALHGGANFFKGSISDSNIAGVYTANQANSGGANLFDGSISTSNIAGVYTANKASITGGGANLFDGSISTSNIAGVYTDNQACMRGGANLFDGSISDSNIAGIYTNNTVYRGVSKLGALISIFGAPFINDKRGGGANYYGSPVSNSKIDGEYRYNNADMNGGANYFYGTVSNSVITGTYDANVAKYGGANAFAFIIDSTLSGIYTNNIAHSSGGANYLDSYAKVSFFDVGYANNKAPKDPDIYLPAPGYGGDIDLAENDPLDVNDVVMNMSASYLPLKMMDTNILTLNNVKLPISFESVHTTSESVQNTSESVQNRSEQGVPTEVNKNVSILSSVFNPLMVLLLALCCLVPVGLKRKK